MENRTEEIDKVAAALVAARAELRNVRQLRENEFLSSRFAPLDSVIDAIVPTLNKHGLTLTTNATYSPDTSTVECVTALLHTSAQYLSYKKVMPVNLARKGLSVEQCVGVAQTYARRTQYLEICALHADTDPDADDGVIVQSVSEEQLTQILQHAERAGVSEEELCEKLGVAAADQIPAAQYARVLRSLRHKEDGK